MASPPPRRRSAPAGRDRRALSDRRAAGDGRDGCRVRRLRSRAGSQGRAQAVALRGRGARDEARQARLVREAKAIAKLSHPNVVGIFDVGVHDGRVFLAMEYLPGGTLRDWLAAERRGWRAIVDAVHRGRAGTGRRARRGAGPPRLQARQRPARQGRAPKIVDFGLVRVTAGEEKWRGGRRGGAPAENDATRRPSETRRSPAPAR